jgi:WD40 repeat protein
MLAVANIAEKSVEVYEMESLRLAATFPMEGWPGFLAFSPDGQFLASDKDDGTVYIWSMQTLGLAASFAAHPGLWTEQADAVSLLSNQWRGFAPCMH